MSIGHFDGGTSHLIHLLLQGLLHLHVITNHVPTNRKVCSVDMLVRTIIRKNKEIDIVTKQCDYLSTYNYVQMVHVYTSLPYVILSFNSSPVRVTKSFIWPRK